MGFPTMWYVELTKAQTKFKFYMTVMLLTDHRLEILSLEGGCTGSSESIYVKTPHCWKSHVVLQY